MTNILANIIRWPRRALAWFLQARLFLFSVTIVVLAFVIPNLYIHTEQGFRISGLVLQLVGLAAAATGIRDTRRKFGKPSFLALVRSWVQRIPGLRPKAISATVSGAVGVSATARGYVWVGPGESPTLESRLSAAEANLEALNTRLNGLQAETEKEVREIKQNARNETSQRQEEDRLLHLKIESASTDGLHLAAVGLLWLASGVILSTVPGELYRLLQ